ncbi:haloalkane dehalogenase [Reticulibacter mediterranei]|uniref:Haloalkane dehalogenase n=1 Tax=Reticulibacter mediterranei TaxID=2778369 RepID=A0A8J3IDK0_9CHLR|nr:haloalkane dehalogenase [Reticulibacter mediterranei]GHO92351.1 haloalkane dehalogenase [Reticulibacter mediterranei]
MTNATFPYPKKFQEVFGLQMAYAEVGSGDPIVFLHGNPTSSYLWRNIIPYLERFGRCIAPDLIGMGDSAKLPHSGPDSYTYVEHRRYLDALLEQLDVRERVTFVAHDWGSALAFDWTCRRPYAVKGLAYMEAVVASGKWDEMSERGRKIFQNLRSPAGEQMVLEQNSFIEVNLPATIQRTLSEEEMRAYRRPFAEPGEGRRPTLSWPRQLPFDGEPVDVTEIVAIYGEWLSHNSIPKLFIRTNPGTMSPSSLAVCCAWPMQTEVSVRGLHYPQEDSPEEVGQALMNWIQTL